MSQHVRWLIVAIVLFATVAPPAVAFAAGEEKPVEGYIVKISGNEIVVDLGSAKGLPQGAALQVYRKLVVEHPVTGKKIVDRFPIGMVVPEEVGEKLSIVRSGKGLTRGPSVGDYVVYVPPTEEESKPRTEPAREGEVVLDKSPAPRAPSTMRADRAALEEAFQDTLGRSLYDRIEILERWLGEYPDSEYAPQVGDEVRFLRVMLEQVQASGEREIREIPETVPEVGPMVVAARRIQENQPLQVEVVMDNPDLVEKVRLHMKRSSEPVYDTVELARGGDFQWRGALPDSLTAEPGLVEYFVDVVRTDGQLETTQPVLSTAVLPSPDAPEHQLNRSRAQLLYEFVDFRVGPGADDFHRAEAEYRYAINTVLNGFTAGAGFFRGSGASLQELNAGEESRSLNLSYAYAEADFEFIEYVGLSGRLLVGNRQQLGVRNPVLRDAFGGNLELRFGNEDGTRLMVGGAVTRAVGAEAWIDLFIDAIDRVPMSGEVVVTNLPVGEELGVSLNYGAGWEFTDWFTLMGRVGWNARTIFDYGFSAGLSTRFEW